MKRTFLLFPFVLLFSLACGSVLAADEGDSPLVVLRPSVSFGYLGQFDNAGYNLLAGSDLTALGAIPGRDFSYKTISSLYLDAGLSVDIGSRLGTEISCRWAVPSNDNSLHQQENYPYPPVWIAGGRAWSARTTWSDLEGSVSYAVLKDVSIIKSIRPKVGVHWDYWNIEGDVAYDWHRGIVVYSPTDTLDFYSSTVMPFGGFSATIGGLSWGNLGGDLVIDAEGGFLAWGEVRHSELRCRNTYRNDVVEGRLDRGYFYDVSIRYTVATLDLASNAKGEIGIFGTMSGYHTRGHITGTRYNAAGGIMEGPYPYRFKMDRKLFATGVTLAVTFDIFGKRNSETPAPAVAPVIEPKLEPMSYK